MNIQYLRGKSFHAARGFLHHLLEEIPDFTRIDNELISCISIPGKETAMPVLPESVYWTRNVWEAPFLLEFDSISEAARALKAIQRNWAPYPVHYSRRTMLIADALPPLPAKPKQFPFTLPEAPMGAFTLLDEHQLLGSARCSSPFPNGEFSFIEDKEGPPSRAYQKLWEALVLAGRMPTPGERCIDAGACPGGWTWALASLGASVTAIDRAPLDEKVAAMEHVTFLKHDAFTLKPSDLGPADWVFSDVICYPEALYRWISQWLESGLAKNFICTIKMQGPSYDRATTRLFAAISGSRVVHLWHNKHELTWMLLSGA